MESGSGGKGQDSKASKSLIAIQMTTSLERAKTRDDFGCTNAKPHIT